MPRKTLIPISAQARNSSGPSTIWPLRRGGREALAIALDEGQVMFAIDVLGDELRLLDDPVELGMPAGEGDEGGKTDALGRQPVRRAAHRFRDMGAGRLAHVADERAEQLLLALEIGVEGAERDAGAAGDAGDRGLVEAALAELLRRRLQQFAHRPPPALGARRLVGRNGGLAEIVHAPLRGANLNRVSTERKQLPGRHDAPGRRGRTGGL